MSSEQRGDFLVQYNADGCDVKLTPNIVQQYIVGSSSKITAQEFKFFTELCRARQLNPFLKEVYCVKYGDEPAQIVVSKDVFLKRAIQHPQYDGKQSGVVVIDKKGNIVERPGLLVLEDEKLVGGWARVYRKDRAHPEYISVTFDEVAGRKKDGRLNFNWLKKPATMVEKVAKVRALREAFTDEFVGMNEAPEDVETLNVIDGIPIENEPVKQEKKRMSLDDIK